MDLVRRVPEDAEARRAGNGVVEQIQVLGAKLAARVCPPGDVPAGRARLATMPLPTGSATNPMTMGTVVVACLAARAAGVVEVTITSTLERTSSAASRGS